MIHLGMTLRCSEEPRHIWIVISDPQRTNGKLLFVNLTTLREDSVDDACIVHPGDYSLLSRATTVAFSRSRVVTASGLAEAIERRAFVLLPDVPPATLDRILRFGSAEPRALARAKGVGRLNQIAKARCV